MLQELLTELEKAESLLREQRYQEANETLAYAIGMLEIEINRRLHRNTQRQLKKNDNLLKELKDLAPAIWLQGSNVEKKHGRS